MTKRFAFIAAYLLLVTGPVLGQVPNSLTVQGRVDTPLTPLSGTASILRNGFPTDYNGVSFAPTVSDGNGVFNLQIVGMSSATFAGSGTFLLRLIIGASTLDIPLDTAAFAFRAATADTLTAGATIQVSTLLASGATVMGNLVTGGSVTASAFFGDGSHLTGIPSTASIMGNTISTLTVTGNAFSVGGSTLVVAYGKVGIGKTNPGFPLDINGTVNALMFIGNGSGLTNLACVVGSGSDSVQCGQGNNASALDSVVSGGNGNNASFYGAFVGGGRGNQAIGDHSVIGGGLSNTAGSGGPYYWQYTVVAGGYGNTANNFASTVSGGTRNTASGIASVVAGGGANSERAWEGNTASGVGSAIVGGGGNIASGNYSVVGGHASQAGGYGSIAFGGESNIVYGNYATVLGGLGNLATGNYSFAAGHKSSATATGAFALSDSQNAIFMVNSSDVFGTRFQGGYWLTGGNVGIGTTSPTYKFDVYGGGHFTSSVTADGGFYGDGSHLTGIAAGGETNTYTSSKTFTSDVQIGVNSATVISGMGYITLPALSIAPAPQEGRLYYDSTKHALMLSTGTNAGAWVQLATTTVKGSGGGGVQFVGLRTPPIPPNFGGVSGADSLCYAAYSGTHWCRWNDLSNLSPLLIALNGLYWAWVDCDYPSHSWNGVACPDPPPTCNGWSSNSGSDTGTKIAPNGEIASVTCDNGFVLPCCK